MERGVYFDAWFPRQHCYHPSLPPRRLRMVEDLLDYRATVLVWSALGGGSVSLPYMEQEAFGAIDARFRFYGFVNDSEFIRECQKHGIKVFGIVFEAQGWEFPVELNEAEDTVLAFNELRGEGQRAWMGLREFSQNRYPKLWAPFEHYFPDDLFNSEGERVSDLLEECCSRDIHGQPHYARWVECPDREHYCYYMDRNNPVWREYLKAVIRIQIDAGVDGVQLDEAATPLTSLQYGGCFCKDCMQGFRSYLQALPAEQLPQELAGVDLASFHYGQWLLERGYTIKTHRGDTPLFWDYLRFQRREVVTTFNELADFARDYAASKGRSVLVSGNFYNLFDQYYPFEPKADLVITEMRNTRYRQPDWYRYVAGFTRDKPTIVVENPYGGIIPELVEQLKLGRGYDRFRMSLYEAAGLGVNTSVPYGAWMGSELQDSFYAPHELAVEIQGFLAEHERLYSRHTCAQTAVVYSIESNFQGIARRDIFADNRSNDSADESVPFWEICEGLSDAVQPYDVLFFPEGELRPDSLRVSDLAQYRTLVLPGCHYLTPAQASLLADYLAFGGRVVAFGALGANLPQDLRAALLEHPGLAHCAGAPEALAAATEEPQVQLSSPADIALNLQRLADGSAAAHIINYSYDAERDAVLEQDLQLRVRLPGSYTAATLFMPGCAPRPIAVERTGHIYQVRVEQLGVYAIVLFE